MIKTSKTLTNSLPIAWLGYGAKYEHLLSPDVKQVLQKELVGFWFADLRQFVED